jgi:hypothetical protein
MSTHFFIPATEILYLLVLITGTVLVFREKKLSRTAKLVWFVLIILFNVFSLTAFLVWKRNERTVETVYQAGVTENRS